MKIKKQDASSVAPLYYDQDGLCIDPLTKSSILGNNFQSVFANEDISTMSWLSRSSYPTMSHIAIHSSGVENLLGRLISHKAAAADAIPALLLCELSVEVAPATTSFTNVSFQFI